MQNTNENRKKICSNSHYMNCIICGAAIVLLWCCAAQSQAQFYRVVCTKCMIKEKGQSDFNFASQDLMYGIDIESDEEDGFTSVSLQSFAFLGDVENITKVKIPILNSQVQFPTEENASITISSTDGSEAEFKIILPSARDTVFTEPLWFYLSDGQTQYLCQSESDPIVLTQIVDMKNFNAESLNTLRKIPDMTHNNLTGLLFENIVKNHCTDADYFDLCIAEGNPSEPTVCLDGLRLVKDTRTNDIVILAELNAFHLRGMEVTMLGSVSVDGEHQGGFETVFIPQADHAWMLNKRLVIPDKFIRKFKKGESEVNVTFFVNGSEYVNIVNKVPIALTFYNGDD